jgi:RNA polymerase sigma-70 factor (ECF subfamily)
MARQQTDADSLRAERDLIARAERREEAAIRAIIQANNRRLFRIARSIVRDDGEAEDVLQEAYLKAFRSLAQFRQEARLATWLTRIVLNEAMQRRRRRTETPVADTAYPAGRTAKVIPFPHSDPLSGQPAIDPERAMAQSEICQLLERAIDDLPDDFRTILIARTLEGLSIEETAEMLDLNPATVKTRLHRARELLRASLAEHLEPLFADTFPFDGKRCERLTNAVVARLTLGQI